MQSLLPWTPRHSILALSMAACLSLQGCEEYTLRSDTTITSAPTDLITTGALAQSGAEDESDAASPIDANQNLDDNWWKPRADQNLTWQWQLTEVVDTTFDVDVYNVDIETPKSTIDLLKARGIKVICYFSAGTVEHFRDDATQFPSEVIGEPYEDIPDENWIDFGNIAAIAPIMLARMDTCASKGFDAIETDNVDAFNYETVDVNGNVTNTGTNFNITLQQSIDYIRWLANEAHNRGLSIGLKNAEAMAPDVVDDVDWMLTEDCYVDNWCDDARIFIDNNKPVFMTEYDDLLPDFGPACALANDYGFTAIWRDSSLGTELYYACPNSTSAN